MSPVGEQRPRHPDDGWLNGSPPPLTSLRPLSSLRRLLLRTTPRWLLYDDDCPALLPHSDVPVPTGEAADDCLEQEQHDEDDERRGP